MSLLIFAQQRTFLMTQIGHSPSCLADALPPHHNVYVLFNAVITILMICDRLTLEVVAHAAAQMQ